MTVGLSAAEQTFTGTGHLMATARGQQNFPNVDVGGAEGPTNYTQGVATFQGKDGQRTQYGTISTPDLAKLQAAQLAGTLQKSVGAQGQAPKTHTASNIEQVAGGLRASITAAATAPASSHAEAVRNASPDKTRGGRQ